MISTDIIVTYLADDNPSDDLTVTFMTQGLSAVKKWESMVGPKIFFQTIYGHRPNGLFTRFALFAGLVNRLHRIHTMREYRNTIRVYSSEVQKAHMIYRKGHDEPTNQFLKYLQELMMAAFEKEGAIETSVITGCSIIAPYVGTLRKPFQNLTNVEDPEDDTPVTESHTLASLAVKRQAKIQMHRIIEDNASLHLLMERSELFDEIDPPEELSRVVSTVNAMHHSPIAVAAIYYGWAFLYQNAALLDLENIANALATIQNPADASFERLMEAWDNLLPASETKLMTDMEALDTFDKYMKDPDKYLDQYKAMDKDPTALFDLDTLMNFIYTNRRFRSDAYTRSRFMTAERIADYVFYKSFVIIVPKSADGNDSPFLYVPVIDDLNGSRPAIIKFWRDGKIDILSESAYNEEVGNVR